MGEIFKPVNCTPYQHWLRWLGDVARGILLTGCDPGMIGCLEWHTYWSGHRPKLKPDRIDSFSYSTRNCGAAVAGLNVYVSKGGEIPRPKLGRQREWRPLSLVKASSWPVCY